MPSGGTAPPRAGIGLRAPHLEAVARLGPPVAFLEIHAENVMADLRMREAVLALRRDHPVAVHGVGMSLGAPEGIDPGHLARFAAVVRLVDPCLVSEHLALAGAHGVFVNDLLPPPMTRAALDAAAANVARVQDAIGRRILVENPSRYVAWADDEMDEAAFLAALVARTGCGLLCDINNIVVSAHNVGIDPHAYLAGLPQAAIGEFHLAGATEERIGDETLLVDAHAEPVGDPAWALYAQAVALIGTRPTLVEWDNDLPPLEVLVAEAAKADRVAAAALSRAA
jgi:uncharacterized protein (UPF0276 family)